MTDTSDTAPTREDATSGEAPHRYTAALAAEIEATLAGPLGRGGHVRGAEPGRPDGRAGEGRRPAEEVRHGHVPVPLRRGPARRPPAGLHRHRRLRPLPADDRPQRPAHPGLRRLRPARRAVRGADRPAPADHHRAATSRRMRRSCAGWAWRTTAAARRDDRPGATTGGPSGSSCRSSTPGTTSDGRTGPGRSPSWIARVPRRGDATDARMATARGPTWTTSSAAGSSTSTGWPTSPRRRSTGAPAWAPCWPTRRSPPTAAASAATSRSSSATCASG